MAPVALPLEFFAFMVRDDLQQDRTEFATLNITRATPLSVNAQPRVLDQLSNDRKNVSPCNMGRTTANVGCTADARLRFRERS
jgi:hypothetical protein